MCVAPVPLNLKSNVKHSFKKAIGLVQDSDVINVPCGKCIECRKTHINGWIFRLTNEFKASTTKKAYFLTLTYNDDEFAEHLHIDQGGSYASNGELSLNYRHHQNFIKRLRKKCPNNGIKYFSVGEYGERTGRPHFHSIMFNADQADIISAWGHGNIHFGDVTEASITYTLKYALKRIGRTHDKNYQEKKDATGRAIERALMSKGLGIEYANDPKNKQYYNADITRTVTKPGGQKQSLSRYYRDKFYTEGKKAARAKLAQAKFQEATTPERLQEKRAIARHAYNKEKANQDRRKNTGD